MLAVAQGNPRRREHVVPLGNMRRMRQIEWRLNWERAATQGLIALRPLRV